MSHNSLLSFNKVCISLLLTFFYFTTYFIQSSGLDLAYHPANILYISTLLLVRFKAERKYCVILCLFYFIVFHQYGSDPYSDVFVSFLSGYYKLVVILVFFSCLSFKKSILGSLFVLIIFFSSLLNAILDDSFRAGYIFNDAFFFILLSSSFFIKNEFFDSEDIEDVVFLFSISMPIVCLFVYFFGLGTERFGSYIFFYGHLFLFILIYPVFYLIRKKAKLNILFKILIVMNGIIFMLSAQSAQYLILIVVIVTSLIFEFNFKKISLAVVFFIAFLLVIFNVESGTWLSLKINQLLALFSMSDFTSIIEVNSLAIRVFEFLIIFESNSVYQHFFGNGLGSIYLDINHYFSYLNLHSATFSMSELATGEYYLIHESVVKVFFISGFVGLLIFLYENVNNVLKSKSDPLNIAIIIYFVMLGLSGVQFSAFITMLYILTVNSAGEKCQLK